MRITRIQTSLARWKGPVESNDTPFVNPLVRLGPLPRSQDGYRFLSALVVEVFDDEGHVGVGTATLSPEVCKAIVDHRLGPMLIGADPRQTEALFARMYLGSVAYGQAGCTMAALSALDIALWDLKGCALDAPVFHLLGGRTKTAIPAYYSRLYHHDVEPLVAEARSAREAGFAAMKMRLTATAGAPLKTQLVDAERRVGAVRDVIGPHIDLMVEAYMGFTLSQARELIEVLAPFKLRWIEEPLLPTEMSLMPTLRRNTKIPLAAGEHAFGRQGYHDLLRQGAVDVLQIDVNRVGGFTEALRACHLAEVYGVEVIPHGSEAHNLHLVTASYACPIAEYFPRTKVEVGNELYWYLFDGELDASGGHLRVRDEPGLGIKLRSDLEENFNIERAVIQ